MTTQMDRSAFHAIRDKQQIDKYDTLNTYDILLQAEDQQGYGGDSSNYIFKNFLQPIGKEHIKNARCRLKFIDFASLTANGVFGVGFLRSNLGKNTIMNGSLSSGLLGGFKLEEIHKHALITDIVPAIQTLGAVANGIDGALLPSVGSNTGANLNPSDDAVVGILTQNALALGNTTQATHNIRSYNPEVKGLVGIPLNSSWVACDNPFGKDVDVSLVGGDMVTPLEAAGVGNTCSILLEVQLLPDNQANDKFTY